MQGRSWQELIRLTTQIIEIPCGKWNSSGLVMDGGSIPSEKLLNTTASSYTIRVLIFKKKKSSTGFNSFGAAGIFLEGDAGRYSGNTAHSLRGTQ